MIIKKVFDCEIQRFINNSGITLGVGDVVSIDITQPSKGFVVIPQAQGEKWVLGVVDKMSPRGEPVYVNRVGFARVKVNNSNGAIVAGDKLIADSGSTVAVKANESPVGEEYSLGIALESYDGSETSFILMDVTAVSSSTGGAGGGGGGGSADSAGSLTDGSITVTAGELDKAVRGKHTIFVPANAMFPRTDNGAGALVYVQVNATGPNYPAVLLNGTTESFAQFTIAMPKSWDGGDIQVQFVWSHPSGGTSFGTVWGARAACLSDDSLMNVSFGSTITISDTGGTADKMYISGISSPLVMSGIPDTSDMTYVIVEVNRVVANAGDNLDVNARLHAVSLFYTTDSASDE